jgi:signal transduction histidine kinase
LEDNAGDAGLIQHTLRAGGLDCAIKRVHNRADYLAELERGGWDLVLADYSMPGFDGCRALELLRQRTVDLPFIFVSGTIGEERAIESLKNGATDYVLKDRLSRLVPAVHRAMEEVEQRAERRRAEAAREDYSRKLQTLSRRLVEAQETERRHLARELHDEIGQTLTLAQLNLQAVLPQVNANSGQQGRLQECLTAVERVLEQVHDISLNLRPSILDDLGLEAALRWYTHRQAALVGITPEFIAPPLPQRVDARVETECFRIAQEALTNVVRHAHAKKVTVELQATHRQLELWVRDDGVGFDVEQRREHAAQGASLGLLSMEERAALAGGGLQITARAGGGTEVHAWLPLQRPAPINPTPAYA